MKPKLPLPRAVEQLYLTLLQLSNETYLVGGAVRDFHLKRKIKDYDFCIDQPVEVVQKHLKRAGYHLVLTGLRYESLTVVGPEKVEVTSFRRDLKYIDHRFPETAPTRLLSEDLARRDFTINAMCWHQTKGLVDLFSGLEDLNNGIIRTVLNPLERFEEDALRMLRAFRFAARYQFQIEPATLAAIAAKQELIKVISKERINQEMQGILAGLGAGANLALMEKVGLLASLYPLTVPTPMELAAMTFLPSSPDADEELILAANYLILFHLNPLSAVLKVARAYKFSNRLIRALKRLSAAQEWCINPDRLAFKMMLELYDDFDFTTVFTYLTHYAALKQLDSTLLNAHQADLKLILERHEPFRQSELKIDGYALMALGISGEMIKVVKTAIWKQVLIDPHFNTKEKLLAYVKEHYT